MAKDFFKIDDNIKEVTRSLDYYQKRVVPEATAASINKGAAKARTQIARSLSAIFQLPQKIIRRRMRVRRANKRTLKGRLWAGLGAVKMKYLRPRQTKTGVTAGKHRAAHAFIAPVGSTTNVFKRKGRARLPLVTQKVVLGDKADQLIRRITKQVIRTFFPKELRRQIEWRANKLAGIK